MSRLTTCPGLATLRRLLDDKLADEEADVNAHLQECRLCQAQLESMVAGQDSWDEVTAVSAADPVIDSAEPALAKTVIGLEYRQGGRPPDSSDTSDLDFLAPPRRSGFLGALDHYDVEMVVGRGGMGIVLKAVDTVLQRVVAVKAMTPALALSAQARRRFIREAQAAAAVAHEHVVTIHAVQDGTVPYLVMQFVAGASLEDKIQQTGALPLKEILRIGMQIAAGLAAAHAQGLVHRDIKPANILLENGVERVKITDFGLACQVENAGLSTSGLIAGTPGFMAPEQARGESIGYRADLFSLGSVLYAMCTGTAPFPGATNLAVLRDVCDKTPRPIRDVNPSIPRALAAIVERLHCKNPADRFGSAAEVAHLLAAQLAGVQAHGLTGRMPPVPASAPAKPVWWRRRTALWLTAVVGAALSLAIGAFYFGNGRAVIDDRMPKHEDAAAAAAVAWQHAISTPIICRGHVGAICEVALAPDGATMASGGEDRKVRLWNARTGTSGHVLAGHSDPVHALVFSSDGKTLASGAADGEIRLWNVATGGLLKTLRGHRDRVDALVFSADGQTLVSAGHDRTIRVWELQTGRERSWIEEERVDFIRRLAFMPDGRTLVSAGNQITFWDVQNGNRQLSTGCKGTTGLAVPADGRFLVAASGRSGVVALFDPVDGKQQAVWQTQDPFIESIALSSSGDVLVTVGADGVARAWNPGKQQLRAEWPAHAGRIAAAAMSPDGVMLVTGGAQDGSVIIWDLSALAACLPVAAPQPLLATPLRHRLEGHTAPVLAVAFTPDGKTLASGGHDKIVRLWEVATGKAGRELAGHEGAIQQVAFSSDRATLASGGGAQGKGEVILWDVTEGTPHVLQPGLANDVMDIAFSADGKFLASCGFDATLRIYDVAARQEAAAFASKQPSFTRRIAFAPDGQTLLTCGDLLISYSWPKGVAQLDPPPHRQTSDMRLTPRGDLLAASAWKTGEITLFAADTLKWRGSWTAHRSTAEAMAFSPDGRFLVSTSADGTAKIWEIDGQRLRAVLLGHRGDVYGVAFSPDGQTVATTGSATDFGVLLWDVSSLGIHVGQPTDAPR